MKLRLLLFWLFFFIFLSTGFAAAQEEHAAGVITEFSGAVEIKKEGAEKPEPITAQTQNLSLYQNDTLTTGADGSTKITLSDGTVLTLAPNTAIVLQKTDDHITVELKTGKMRVDCKSDSFTLKTPHHTFTGAGASLEVAVPQKNEVTVFCIDGKPTVTDQNGFQIFPEEGQLFTAKYDEAKKEFEVKADEYNEEDLNCKGKDKEYKIPPGKSVWVNSDLAVSTLPRPEIKLAKIEEPRDEPYEDAGDICPLSVVSPKKP
jgi:hypothetical protein